MLKRFKRIARGERGQSVVEMAIVLPVLLLLLCGIIDFGWISYSRISLSYCSREGARYGVVHAEAADAQTQITNKVIQSAPDFLKDKITVTVTFSNPSSPRLGDITVTVNATVTALTPVAGTIFGTGTGIPLTSLCVMKVE
jgi:Flp pilus assembly protein TadG